MFKKVFPQEKQSSLAFITNKMLCKLFFNKFFIENCLYFLFFFRKAFI